MPDAADDSDPLLPFGEAFRQIQDIGAQLSEAAWTMADEFARSPAGRFAEPMVRLGSQTAELATMWVAPVRAMLQEQEELINALSSWAEQQKQLAETFSALAERHRKLNAQVTSVLDPLLERVAEFGTWGRPQTDEPDR
jgi:methyl-accepting chemotaxis protein